MPQMKDGAKAGPFAARAKSIYKMNTYMKPYAVYYVKNARKHMQMNWQKNTSVIYWKIGGKGLKDMLNNEAIQKANAQIKYIDIGRGKDYAEVKERVKAFRAVFSDYSIETEILAMDDGIVTMRATITDPDGRVIATGHAQERKDAGRPVQTGKCSADEKRTIQNYRNVYFPGRKIWRGIPLWSQSR